jgi:hypothetical protein
MQNVADVQRGNVAHYRFEIVQSDKDSIWDLVERYQDRNEFEQVKLMSSAREFVDKVFIKVERCDKNGHVIDVGITGAGALPGRKDQVVMTSLARTANMSGKRVIDARAFQLATVADFGIDLKRAISKHEDDADHGALKENSFKPVSRMNQADIAPLNKLVRGKPERVFQNTGRSINLSQNNWFMEHLGQLLDNPKIKIEIGLGLKRLLGG